ncbi:unnamed protein product [Effrenium voratum]|nr:unnamed protein product [Effrenium voratum]
MALAAPLTFQARAIPTTRTPRPSRPSAPATLRLRAPASVASVALGATIRAAQGESDESPGTRSKSQGRSAFALILARAAACGVAAAGLFCPLATSLRSLLATPAQEVLKDDMTQFSQNAFAVVLLLLGLLLGETLSMLLQRQDRLYHAIYCEVSEARSLIEQLVLLSGCREGLNQSWSPSSKTLLETVEAYLVEDLQNLGKSGLLPDRGGAVDPLESMLFVTSVGLPSCICDSVRSIRQARAERLAAAQRRFPLGHQVILSAMAACAMAVFILLAAGLAGFEADSATKPGHLLTVLAPLFGLLMSAQVLTASVLTELSNCGGSDLFRAQDVVQQSLSGLLAELRQRQKM